MGDGQGMQKAAPNELPAWMGALLRATGEAGAEPPQNLKEYDPEWARA
ncbi:MAG: hypothetical protein WEF50_16300 [Myxococcota bacterium]